MNRSFINRLIIHCNEENYGIKNSPQHDLRRQLIAKKGIHPRFENERLFSAQRLTLMAGGSMSQLIHRHKSSMHRQSIALIAEGVFKGSKRREKKRFYNSLNSPITKNHFHVKMRSSSICNSMLYLLKDETSPASGKATSSIWKEKATFQKEYTHCKNVHNRAWAIMPMNNAHHKM